MKKGQRVLVVDGLLETEQVLKAVFEPRGLLIDRIRTDHQKKLLKNQSPPELMVIHQNEAYLEDHSDSEQDWGQVPRVIIGSAQLETDEFQAPQEKYLQNPFQYGELVQAIEHLLEAPESQRIL